MGSHINVGMRIGLKGHGRWWVESIDDCFITLVKRCRDGSVETWKVLKTRAFI